MMIWLWSAIGAVGGVCWWIPAIQEGCLFLVLVRLSPCFLTWSLMVLLWRWSMSWRFWVTFLTPGWLLKSLSNSCLCLKEGGYLEWVFSCRLCGQMILGIHTSCSGLLLYSLDVDCHFHLLLLDTVVGRVSRLSKQWKFQLWSCQRRKVASLCAFFKIDSLVGTLCVYSHFPAQYVMRRPTHGALTLFDLMSDNLSSATDSKFSLVRYRYIFVLC